MQFIAVIVAALASFGVGAVWYMSLAKPWMEASGVKAGPDGRPANGNDPVPYIISFVCALIVAGMMRHLFVEAGIVTLGKGLVTGLGIGAFFITPWIAMNNTYGGRPMRLTQIDGGYAILGCGAMGLVLALFL